MTTFVLRLCSRPHWKEYGWGSVDDDEVAEVLGWQNFRNLASVMLEEVV